MRRLRLMVDITILEYRNNTIQSTTYAIRVSKRERAEIFTESLSLFPKSLEQFKRLAFFRFKRMF